MAVFTAIASVITGAITGAGFSAAFAAATAGTLTGLGIATSLLAGGIAVATAKAMGPKVPSIQSAKDPGVKIQLDPSTDNKLPVYYGSSFLGGIAIDAMIKNQNNTMVYAFAIGEQTDSGSFSIGNIYRGDAKLNFGTGANAHTVVSLTDPNGTAVTNVNGKMRCRVYAGNTYANAQIFPVPGGSTVAVDADTMFTNWSSDPNKIGNNTIISIFELDYDAGNGLQGLGVINYELTNSLKNPANVLLDYLKNDRYGCGLTDADLDLTSFDDMYDYANTQVIYTPSSGGSAYHSRWEINGGLSTFQPNLTNIDQICQNSATFFTYNAKTGQYKVVPNRAATAGELANAFVFNDTNIVSSINVTEPDLYSTYNQADIEYSNGEAKDQTDTVFLDIPVASNATLRSWPSIARLSNEPLNTLTTRLYLTNDKARATNLGNIDLNQGRLGRTVEFEANHTALTVDVGDVVKINSPQHNFNDQLYRVMRVQEQDKGDGLITTKIIGMYYDSNVYIHADAQNEGAMGNSNIPTIPVIGLPVPGVFDGTYGNLTLNGGLYGNVVVNQTMKTFGAGAQLEDAGLDTGNANIASGTDLELITPQLYDLTDSDPGDYTFTAEASLGGTITGPYDVAFNNNVTLTFANATNVANINYGGGGVYLVGVQDFTPQLVDSKKVSTNPVDNGLPADYKIANATIRLQGNTTIDASNAAIRKFGNMGYAMTRITKGEK